MIVKEGVHVNGIYQHYKNKDLYKVLDVSYDHETSKPYIIYSKCDENGIYKSIRSNDLLGNEVIIKQPFSRSLQDFNKIVETTVIKGITFVPRFKFIKQL